MAYQYYSINDNRWCGPFDPNKHYVGVVLSPLGWNGFQFSSVFTLLLFAHEVGNDVEPRVDAEKMKEENYLRTPLPII